MKVLSVNQFRANIKTLVDQAIADHEPVKVTRRAGQDFIIVSAEDWDRDQETLYVMQNSSIINQIRESILTHDGGTGYAPTQEELDEINRI
ncbi:MAG: type II toxin-antitoxin system Phd/YefM family antitoxin [Candidatus Marinimicrobia bacterium]|nr:type II toxin-antitoxin system Phd/YefM family antitoxin [Candidatus Neomarinimicrobiota bacterium]